MRKHWLVLLLVAGGLTTGCATIGRATDVISKVAHATADSVDILKGPVEDVASVWEETGLASGDSKSAPEDGPVGGDPVDPAGDSQ